MIPTPDMMFSSDAVAALPSAVLRTTYTCPMGASWSAVAYPFPGILLTLTCVVVARRLVISKNY